MRFLVGTGYFLFEKIVFIGLEKVLGLQNNVKTSLKEPFCNFQISSCNRKCGFIWVFMALRVYMD